MHGTARAFQEGCDCDACWDAYAKNRPIKLNSTGPAPAKVLCGTYSGYVYGCRCEDCTVAARDYKRATRAPRPRPRRTSLHPRIQWLELASCKHPEEYGLRVESWFPRPGRPSFEEHQARALCARCPVRVTCLDEAMLEEREITGLRYGIRGGLDGEERAVLAERRASA